MKLRVRNNWEKYEWTLDGLPVDVREIESVNIEGWDYNVQAVKKYNQVYDHGHTYSAITYDLEIEAEVAETGVWISLYDNPKLLSKVIRVVN